MSSMTLEMIGKQITIYIGFAILIFGFIGSVFNLIVFLSLRTFRENSCAFYLIVMSMFNIGQLLSGLLTRIVIIGFSTEWTTSSLFYCKFRGYQMQTCILISLTCYCLATIDQFFATTAHVRLQQFCNIKIAQRICIGVILVWHLHGIPFLTCFDLINNPNGSKLCTITNPMFYQYFTYGYQYVLCSFLPVIITILFGCLAFYNVRRNAQLRIPNARRELDKQLTAIVLCTVLLNSLTLIPFSIIQLFPSDDTITEFDIFDFAVYLTRLLFFVYFAVSDRFFLRFTNLEFFYFFFRIHSLSIFVYPNDFVDNLFTF